MKKRKEEEMEKVFKVDKESRFQKEGEFVQKKEKEYGKENEKQKVKERRYERKRREEKTEESRLKQQKVPKILVRGYARGIPSLFKKTLNLIKRGKKETLRDLVDENRRLECQHSICQLKNHRHAHDFEDFDFAVDDIRVEGENKKDSESNCVKMKAKQEKKNPGNKNNQNSNKKNQNQNNRNRNKKKAEEGMDFVDKTKKTSSGHPLKMTPSYIFFGGIPVRKSKLKEWVKLEKEFLESKRDPLSRLDIYAKSPFSFETLYGKHYDLKGVDDYQFHSEMDIGENKHGDKVFEGLDHVNKVYQGAETYQEEQREKQMEKKSEKNHYKEKSVNIIKAHHIQKLSNKVLAEKREKLWYQCLERLKFADKKEDLEKQQKLRFKKDKRKKEKRDRIMNNVKKCSGNNRKNPLQYIHHPPSTYHVINNFHLHNNKNNNNNNNKNSIKNTSNNNNNNNNSISGSGERTYQRYQERYAAQVALHDKLHLSISDISPEDIIIHTVPAVEI